MKDGNRSRRYLKMSENEKMTETEKLMKAVEAAEEKIEKCFAELQDSLQKIIACECGGPLLTEKEHSYLSSIIKPFRDRVIYIGKFTEGEDKSFIEIGIDGDLEIVLPSFLNNQMYLEMEMDEKYSLKRLGL
jgi:hypothetical protein